ncbi:MAG TPA: hypothetical protein VKV17_03310 [Bryobacteraceae bacterium]|nr:hypothetical protein [Bryobacteraceae bacterium]
MTPMLKELVFWVGLPGLVAVGSAALVWMLMQARMQLLATNYKAAIAEAEKAAAESRPRLEDLLAELRLERRQYLRKTSGVGSSETTILTLERLYFRQVPLTGWMQEEIPLGAGEVLPGQMLLFQELAPNAGVGTVSLVPG